VEVLVIAPDFPPARGGIQALLFGLVSHVPGVTFRVVTCAHPDAQSFDAQAPCEVLRVATGGLPRRASIAALDAGAVRAGYARRPDAVLSGHIVCSPAARAIRRPWLQYVYAKEVAARPRLARHAMCHAHATVAISRYTQDLALGLGVEPGRLHLIPPGVDQLAARVHSSTTDDPIILTICRLEDRYKGVDVLIRALTAIRSDVPRARLVVVGAGSLLPWLEGLASAEGVGEHVLFAGSVSDAERDSWLERAAVFAMPSRLPPEGVGGEGFGIVYLEASARGVPVVAGTTGGAPDAVSHGTTGLLVDPTDDRAVAAAISSILTSSDLHDRLSANGPQWVEQFAWPRPAELLGEVLRSIVV
jgi:phosphatidylinositol alpha-1,6-mannosyltransferase